MMSRPIVPMLGIALLGIALGAIVAMQVLARGSLTPPEYLAEASCNASTCDIEVTPFIGSGYTRCALKLSRLVKLGAGVDMVRWKITTGGYAFAKGGNAVTILNDPQAFKLSSATAAAYTFDRVASAPMTLDYNMNVVPVTAGGSSAGAACTVPSEGPQPFPRIKNE